MSQLVNERGGRGLEGAEPSVQHPNNWFEGVRARLPRLSEVAGRARIILSEINEWLDEEMDWSGPMSPAKRQNTE